ncbi:MAG: homoserine dehydrogenase [Candidatus Saganbacteria bacterium]|nr:homoserine dehydrogenase [Candidatus Saganbacteria bacterium]
MKKINIGIIGFGTVGSAVAEVLRKNKAVIAERAGVGIGLKAVCDIRRIKTSWPLTPDPMTLINDPDIAVVVETMGGVNPAKKYVLAALKAGKHVVTSNKELIARHLPELLAAAAENNVSLLFEGAVGGGIPILDTLRDNLAANKISEVYGIVNGTTNYILSRMTAEGKDFGAVLKAAQKLGYAEADPRADIEGYDASYKAAILAAVAYGARVRWESVYREGLEKITAEDIAYAGEIGYAIKLLAVAKLSGGALDVRVHPALVAKTHPLSNVDGNFNAIYVKGFPVGELMFYGPGAGGNPTASAVINDILAALRAPRPATRGLKPFPLLPIAQTAGRYYIRLQAPDKPGVLAGISKIFADKKVSIAAVTQKETIGNLATIVILVHGVKESSLVAALRAIKRLPVVRAVGNVIRIL